MHEPVHPRGGLLVVLELNCNTLVRMTGVANEKPREIIWFNGGYQARGLGVADLPREQLKRPPIPFRFAALLGLLNLFPSGRKTR